ncbi:MAG: DNA mismatch repair protein MutT [Candidatus Accumulibacter sp.]|nr:DNA mismatch repair protein MutT [Accumulibacter sp.]
MTKIVEVAAAVMLRAGETEFLLAQRPEGKVYAGYWEFPGGKVEPGESVRDALVRELREELGIAVTAATPWLTREFTYPHATVRLNFWRVTAWDGEIGITAPLEHSAVDWMRCADAWAAPSVAPILPANGPILKALALPAVMAITNSQETGEDAELERLSAAAGRGIRLFQIRDKTLPVAERAWFAQTAMEMLRNSGALVVVNDDSALAQRIGAHGVHLSAAALRACNARPDLPWVGASCHDAGELVRAAQFGLDYVLLAPVLPTPTHPGRAGLGWEEFGKLAAGSPLPVFALGGMRPEMLETARRHGAHGIALMRGW